MLIGQKLAVTANKNSSKVAFRYLAKTTNYKEAYSYINRYSYFLQNEIQHNKRVLVYMSNCPHMAYTFFALANTKNVAVFVDPNLPEPKIADKVKELGIEAVICSDDYLTRVNDLVKNYGLHIPVIQCEQRRWGEYDTTYRLPVSMSASDTDVVALFETAGTSGKPKLVGYTHAMLDHACLLLKSAYRLGSIDNFFSYQSSLAHSFYFIHGLIMPLINGAAITITDLTAPDELAKELLEAKVTRVIARGVFVEDWLNNFKALNIKVPTLRSITPEYFPANPRLEELTKTDFNECRILNNYGSVETTWAVASRNFEEPEPFDSVGKLLPGVKTRVIDENGDDIPAGKPQRGQLLVSGANVATGYLNNKDATKLNFRGQWFFTGDYIDVEKSGVVRFLDRKDNVCTVMRQILFPTDIEKKLMGCPGVQQVAIVSLKDALGKLQITAIINKKPGVDISAQDVSHFSELSLAENERPRSVAFMAEFPMTPHGFVDKYRLRFDFGS